MATNPFRSGVRPWTRITNAARALAMGALGAGELAVTETGKVVAGNGTTPLKNLSPFLTQADAVTQFVTWDGTNLRINGTIIPISGGPAVVVDSSTGGVLTLSGSGVTEQGGIITLNGSNVTEQNGVITIA
jgi:hypothetical protein